MNGTETRKIVRKPRWTVVNDDKTSSLFGCRISIQFSKRSDAVAKQAKMGWGKVVRDDVLEIHTVR